MSDAGAFWIGISIMIAGNWIAAAIRARGNNEH